MTLTPAELAQLAAEDEAHDRRIDALDRAAAIAFANVEITHAERFAAEQRAGIARAQAALDRLDRTLVQQ